MVYMIAVIFSLISSLFFLAAGSYRSIHGYAEFFRMFSGDPTPVAPGLHIAEALDSFLLALVFLTFGLGIMKTFTHYHVNNDNLPAWLQIKDFKSLKILLWETIILTLVVFTITHDLDIGSLTWASLIMPCIILILSVSLYIVKKVDH